MKKISLWVAASFVFAAASVRLTHRWREESLDRRVALVVDWIECRDMAGRPGISNREFIQVLQQHGVSALLLSAITLQDLYEQHDVWPAGPLAARDAFDAARLQFADAAVAAQTYQELARRGVADLKLDHKTLSRAQSTFLPLKDVEIGFDPALLQLLRGQGLKAMFRLNRDPWMTRADLLHSLQEGLPVADGETILFNSDDVPGGWDAMPLWRSWMQHHGVLNALFEFHASKASWLMAKLLPAYTFRAHTIPALEQKDLTPDQEMSRWRRAVEERSCRILLIHASPNDSLTTLLDKLTALHEDLSRQQWQLQVPRFRIFWGNSLRLLRMGLSALALLVAIVTPWLALQTARHIQARSWVLPFLTMTCITLLGACLMAALADNPETRLEITAFRGIKIAFLAGWLGSLFQLYRWEELQKILAKTVRRWDVLLGLAGMAVIGYILIRSGNASAAWKPSMEQGLRDQLESLLLARPRFKEFAFGHPLMILGLFFQSRSPMPAPVMDGRPWMLLGMIGQVSIINTFCHLHSPLQLALGRSFNGLVLGMLGGVILVRLVYFWNSERA